MLAPPSSSNHFHHVQVPTPSSIQERSVAPTIPLSDACSFLLEQPLHQSKVAVRARIQQAGHRAGLVVGKFPESVLFGLGCESREDEGQ